MTNYLFNTLSGLISSQTLIANALSSNYYNKKAIDLKLSGLIEVKDHFELFNAILELISEKLDITNLVDNNIILTMTNLLLSAYYNKAIALLNSFDF